MPAQRIEAAYIGNVRTAVGEIHRLHETIEIVAPLISSDQITNLITSGRIKNQEEFGGMETFPLATVVNSVQRLLFDARATREGRIVHSEAYLFRLHSIPGITFGRSISDRAYSIATDDGRLRNSNNDGEVIWMEPEDPVDSSLINLITFIQTREETA